MSWRDYLRDGYETAKESASNATETVIPDSLEPLTDLSSNAIQNLVDFAEAPFLFLAELFIGRMILPAAEVAISAIQLAFDPLLQIPRMVAEPIITAYQAVFGAIGSAVMMLNDAVVTVSVVAGPAAPLVVLVFWGLIAITAMRALREAIKAIPLVIPWF